jgi:glycosyltransferase involved in cell wall biosynthesis
MIDRKPTIGVAIASFNGIKFIQEQLESICQQDMLPHIISISDDSSTDGTVAFLEGFARRSKVPVVLTVNPIRLGVINNFMEAFRHCNTDYIAYCDQDDVWNHNKISTCMEILIRERPALIFHRSTTVDGSLRPLGGFNPTNIRGGMYRFPYFPDNLWGFGHQMIFSREVLHVMTQIKEAKASSVASIADCFDFSLLVAAGMVGDVYFVDRELMKFRRHARALSPAGKLNSQLKPEGHIENRKRRVTELSTIFEDIILEHSGSRFSPQQDPLLMHKYIKHLDKLRRRYAQLRIIYESRYPIKRFVALMRNLFSRSYGSIKTNKLTRKQLMLDSWRSIRGLSQLKLEKE